MQGGPHAAPGAARAQLLARLWNQLVAAQPDSVTRQVLEAILQIADRSTGEPQLASQRPWAALMAMQAAGVEFDPKQRQRVDRVRHASACMACSAAHWQSAPASTAPATAGQGW